VPRNPLLHKDRNDGCATELRGMKESALDGDAQRVRCLHRNTLFKNATRASSSSSTCSPRCTAAAAVPSSFVTAFPALPKHKGLLAPVARHLHALSAAALPVE